MLDKWHKLNLIIYLSGGTLSTPNNLAGLCNNGRVGMNKNYLS